MKLTRNARSAIFAICAVGLMFSACNGDAANTTDPETEEVKDNLPESQGVNELEGSKYTTSEEQNKVTFDFQSDTVKMSLDSASSANSNVIARSAESETTTGSVFNYSYNSDAKELHFQIKSVLEGSTTSDYKAELEELKETYTTVDGLLIAALKSDSTSTFFQTAKKAGITVIQSYITEKVQNYFNDQMSTLTDYLTAKFNSVMTLGYIIDDASLTLSQKFKNNDLTDASSEFVYDGQNFSMILNDYEKLEPFSVTVGGTKYIGVPKITKDASDEKTGTIIVDLYSELSMIKDDPSSAQKIVTDKVTKVITTVSEKIQDETFIKKVIAELLLNNSESSTLSSAVDSVLASSTLECTFQIGGTELEPTLTFTLKEVPQALSATLSVDQEISLTYKPVIKYELTKVSETE